MTTRPTDSPAFATDATFTAGDETGETPRVDPGSGFKAQGWYPNTRLPTRWANWLWGLLGDWVKYLQEKTDGVFSPMNFDAAGEIITELEDDTTALQDCFDAAYAAIGGGSVTVDLGGRSYRVTGGLSCYPHVNVKNGKIVLYDGGGSTDLLTWETAATQRTDTIWENVELAYAEACTGDVIVNGNAAGVVRVIFHNCHINQSGFCEGKLFACEEESEFLFEKCIGRSGTTGSAMTSDFGTLRLHGGTYTMAPAATSDFCYADTFEAQGVTFVHVSTVGGVAFISLAGSDDFDYSVHDCTFEVDDSGAGGPTYAINLVGSMFLRSSGNRLLNDALMYEVTSAPLGVGSDIQLLSHIDYSISAATTTLPVGYRSYAIESTDASPPAVTIPDPLVEGQPLIVTVWNHHAADAWTGGITFACTAGVYYTEGGGLDDLANLELATIHFEAVVLDGDLVWVQVGAAAQHFVAS